MTFSSTRLEPKVPADNVSVAAALPLLDRDHSILAFNWRVFDWACRADEPLLELSHIHN